MNKKLLVVSLILSIIFLVLMILSYNGTLRKWKLTTRGIEPFLNAYLKKKLGKGRVVVAFNVNSVNKDLKPFLNSLLDQSVRVNEIIAVGEGSIVNAIVKKYPKVVSPNATGKDYSCAGACVCALLREPEANTKIIILDSNVVYPEDMIALFVEESEKNPDKIIMHGNDMLIKPKFFKENVTNPNMCNTPADVTAWIEKCSTVGVIKI